MLLQFEGEGRLAFTASYFVDGALVVPPIEIEAGHVLFCTWRLGGSRYFQLFPDTPYTFLKHALGKQG